MTKQTGQFELNFIAREESFKESKYGKTDDLI